MRNNKKNNSSAEVIMKKAADMVITGGKSYRVVAKEFSIEYTKLFKFCKKMKANQNHNPIHGNNIFKDEEEKYLFEYLTSCSIIYFGLSRIEIRRLACKYALKLEKAVPSNWVKSNMAGKDWLSLFMKRNTGIIIRTPEAVSYRKETVFNAQNCKIFFHKLGELYDRYKFGPESIFNVREICVTILPPQDRIVWDSKENKEREGIKIGEKIVTVACIISASGKLVPPMFVFPQYLERFIIEGPLNCIEEESLLGWMNEILFTKLLKHFVGFTRCSTDRPVLLILGDNTSFISMESLTYAKQNGILLLSFPPCTSHKLQPFDRSVHVPLKYYFLSASDEWFKKQLGRAFSINDIPKFLRIAYYYAMTPTNICKGFEVTGIYPFNTNIFQTI